MYFSHRFLRPFRNEHERVTIPPSPSIGSTKIAHVRLEIFFSTLSIDNFFKVKGKSSQLKDLKVSKRPSKNLARYYLNEDNMDTSELEKLGLLDEVEEEIKEMKQEVQKEMQKCNKNEFFDIHGKSRACKHVSRN